MVIADGSSWALAGSGLTTGSHIPGILGYEVDGELISDSPAGTAIVAKSPIPILDGDAQPSVLGDGYVYCRKRGDGIRGWNFSMDLGT